jgi:hypothetical protein
VAFTGEAAVLADTGVLPFAGTGSFAVLAASRPAEKGSVPPT